jgi:hypothetical protein
MEASGFSPKMIDSIQNILPGPTPINGKEQLLDDEELHDEVEEFDHD